MSLLSAIMPTPDGPDFREEVHGVNEKDLVSNVREWIMFSGYGASDIGATFNVYRDGNIVGTVTYNGKFYWRDEAYKPSHGGDWVIMEEGL